MLVVRTLEGPSTCFLRFPAPKTIHLMVFWTRELKRNLGSWFPGGVNSTPPKVEFNPSPGTKNQDCHKTCLGILGLGSRRGFNLALEPRTWGD